jgi:hypothetical protein
MTKRRSHDDADPESAGQLVPARLYPGAEIQWVAAPEPLGKPRRGHGTLYVNPAADLPDSEWCASWEDDYPQSEIEAHDGAAVGVDSVSGSEEVVLRWARTSPARKHLILQHGEWVPMPLDENWRPEPRPRD